MYNNVNNSTFEINPAPQASAQGTYSVLVTGWSKPENFDWDCVPNLLVKGNLYNNESGVRMLLENLSTNKLIDRVYLLSLTHFDLVSKSCVSAYSAIKKHLPGIECSVYFDLPLTTLPPTHPHSNPEIKPKLYKTSNLENREFNRPMHYTGSDLDAIRKSIAQDIVQLGNHYPNRQFTSLGTIVASIHPCSKPEWQGYFEQWSTDYQFEDVAYTYGQRILPQTERLLGGSDSTQRVITLLSPRDYTGKMPCLTQIGVFDNTMQAVFRSHDIGKAWIPNCQALLWLFYELYPTLENRCLQVISLNAHVYDWDAGEYAKGFNYDPLGYFQVTKNQNLYQLFHNGELVIEAKTRAGLKRDVCKHYPQMSTAHAFYLASEIDRI